jgi:hypothetical protein
MANGDKAAAKGWDVVPATRAHSLGYDGINYVADRVADEVDARATLATTVAGKANTAHTHTHADIDSGTWTGGVVSPSAITGAGFTVAGVSAGFTADGSVIAGAGAIAGDLSVRDVTGRELTLSGNAHLTGNVYVPNRSAVSSGYVAAYINSDGRLGISPSSRRFKKEIKAWSPDKQAVLAMQLVTFRYKAAVYGNGNGPVEVGVIAEDLIALGLDWLVFFDTDGQPEGVHYERIALALLPVIQDHESRLSALELTQPRGRAE